MTIARDNLCLEEIKSSLTKPLTGLWLQGQHLLAENNCGQKRKPEKKPAGGKSVETSEAQASIPKIELKAIPLSEAKYALPAELTAEQLKDMQDRTQETLKTIKQIKDLRTSNQGQSGGLSTNENTIALLGKLKSDVDFYFDSTHNHAQPTITDPQLDDSSSLEKSLGKHWQALANATKQASENEEALAKLLTGKSVAGNQEKVETTLNRIEQNIASFAYPLSNLRSSCFTKQEIADYEEVERQRQGIRYWGLTARDLAPYNKQHELLRPYFQMVNTFVDSMHLANNLSTQDQFQGKLAQFTALFNDDKIRALEASDKIEPGIKAELQHFAHMASLCKLPVTSRHAGDLECMRTPAMEIQGLEFSLKVKEHFGAHWPTHNCVDDIAKMAKQ